MQLQDLNWMDVDRYLSTDDRIILVTGATEQHAYLSLLTDVLIPLRIAQAVAEREGVLIAPPLNFGVSTLFAAFPGTIGLSKQVFDSVLTEIVQSLLYQGFGGFLIINGHVGNSPPTQLEDLRIEGHARIAWYDWWTSEASRAFQAEHGLLLDHANWGENFPFNRVADVPDGEKPPVNLDYLETGQTMRAVLGDGSFGGLYQVDDALMWELYERLVSEAAELARALRQP
ncbi:MAG: creatininase family protein [Aggregatilineales bacterium]